MRGPGSTAEFAPRIDPALFLHFLRKIMIEPTANLRRFCRKGKMQNLGCYKNR